MGAAAVGLQQSGSSSRAPAVIPMSGQGMGFGNVWHWQSIVSWHSLCSSTGNRQCPPMVISLQMKIENKKPPPPPTPLDNGNIFNKGSHLSAWELCLWREGAVPEPLSIRPWLAVCGGVLVTMEMGNGQIEILFTCRALPQGNQTLSIVLVAAGDKEDGGG